ncbi:MAG TPA: PadR family transcriptional regulator [Solirubrobacteraceae bacterium]|nr:PadR family transcriptional regulator [Solirubrobacteraceae bacterium]
MCSHHKMRHYRVAPEDFAFARGRHGGPGPGRGGWGAGPFGGPGQFGGPRGRPRRRRGDVRAALLLLLSEGPHNGYQLMKTLEERSEGRWSPSPGSVYPALSQLEDEGLIQSVQSGSEPGRTFEITNAGREHLAERGEQKPPWELDEDDHLGNDRKAFGKAMVSAAKAAAQVAQEGDAEKIAQATELLTDLRRSLYRLLAEDGE